MRLAIVPRMPLSLVSEVGSCIAGGSAAAGAAAGAAADAGDAPVPGDVPMSVRTY